MAVSFREITRRNGKIFIRLAAPNASEEGIRALAASCATEQGNPLPCRLDWDARSGSPVATLAVLAVPQVLTVAQKGGPAASCTITPKGAQLKSRMNRMTRNAAADTIANADDRSTRGIRVDLAEVMTARSRMVARGTLTIAGATPQSVAGGVLLVALDQAGRQVAADPWVCLDDRTQTDGTTASRRIDYSLWLPAGCAAFTLWARMEPAAAGAPSGEPGTASTAAPNSARSGFLCCEDFFVADMRRRWQDEHRAANDDPAYEDWFLNHHRASERELAAQRAQAAEEPAFSVFALVGRAPTGQLEELVSSVLAQTYPPQEVLLVNTRPGDVALAGRLSQLAGAAPGAANVPVRVVPADAGTGTGADAGAAAALAQGLRACTGDFVCLLGEDGALEPDALRAFADALAEYPQTDLLYADEDRRRNGHYLWPFFKPDWSPDLLCSTNYLGHPLCVRQSLARELAPELAGFDGAPEHALALMAGERARNVHHVRRVLYHGAAVSDSPNSLPLPPRDPADGARAIRAHLERLGINAQVTPYDEPDLRGTYRVAYRFGADAPLVSLVIPNKDMVPVLDRCLASIRQKTTYPNYEVVVVENNSTEPETFAYYQRAQDADPRVRVVTLQTDGTFNFPRTINFGVAHAQGDYVLMLNNDTEVISPDWLEQMMGLCQREDVGAVGAKLLFPDGTFQHAGVDFDGGPGHLGFHLPGDSLDYYHLYQLPQDLTMVTGACLLCSRSLYDELGGLDEAFCVDYNDVDFCLRIRAKGLLVAYQPTAELYHYDSVTRGAHDRDMRTQRQRAAKEMLFIREKGLLMQRWPGYYYWGDPYLSPSLHGPYRTLRW